MRGFVAFLIGAILGAVCSPLVVGLRCSTAVSGGIWAVVCH